MIDMKDKIPFYNLVNMFFVGAVFSFWIAVLYRDSLIAYLQKSKDILDILQNWEALVTAVLLIAIYEIGFVINRLSSITIGKFFAFVNIWPKEKYSIDVSEISAENAKFNSMITELNVARSHVLIYCIICILAFCAQKYLIGMGCVILVITFSISGRSHNEKINIIKDEYRERTERQKQEQQKQQDKENEEQAFLNYAGGKR